MNKASTISVERFEATHRLKAIYGNRLKNVEIARLLGVAPSTITNYLKADTYEEYRDNDLAATMAREEDQELSKRIAYDQGDGKISRHEVSEDSLYQIKNIADHSAVYMKTISNLLQDIIDSGK